MSNSIDNSIDLAGLSYDSSSPPTSDSNAIGIANMSLQSPQLTGNSVSPSDHNRSSSDIDLFPPNRASSPNSNQSPHAPSCPRPTSIHVALTEEQKADLREIFELVDTDRSGSISNEELHELMKMLGMNLTLAEINEMVRQIDENNDGEIQFDEFLAVMSRKMRAHYNPEDVRSAFSVFESQAPMGCVKTSTLESVLCAHGTKPMSQEEAHALVQELSHMVDGSGYFKYEDYIREMYSDETQ